MINLKRLTSKNGWPILGLSIFFILLTGCKTYEQVKESNEAEIDKIKTQETKTFIEKSIVGYWAFEKLTSPSGVRIEQREIVLDTIIATEEISRPDIVFESDKSYRVLDNGNVIEEGKWLYDDDEKVLKFIFDEPRYNVPIENTSPELLEKLKKEGTLIEFTENLWEVHQITDSKLSVIEHLPHDEFELKYNLRVYKKKY